MFISYAVTGKSSLQPLHSRNKTHTGAYLFDILGHLSSAFLLLPLLLKVLALGSLQISSNASVFFVTLCYFLSHDLRPRQAVQNRTKKGRMSHPTSNFAWLDTRGCQEFQETI